MSIQGVDPRCFILALFVRDDNERLVLGTGAYEFKNSQRQFAANTLASDVVQAQGSDGQLLAGQVRRSATQNFDGYIGTFGLAKTKIEELRREFIAFFEAGHLFTVIYVFPDGSAIQRQRGYLVDAPEVKEIYQISPEYHVALAFENVDYYEYNEDDEGNEIYSNSVVVPLVEADTGGLIFDTVGVVFDTVGAEWQEGGSSPIIITIDATGNSYPVWTVEGLSVNPVIENLTTGSKISYDDTIVAGQTLVVDMNAKQALLNGLDVTSNISGDWFSLAPGNNRLLFTDTSGTVKSSTLEWNSVVG